MCTSRIFSNSYCNAVAIT
uniref:Uncharacterized protein n=1 Tax=Arundo donax TaxID=35708 RepID=A0A0A9FJ16_ARUDO